MKKVIALLLALVMVASLAACSKEAADDSKAAATEAATKAPEATEEAKETSATEAPTEAAATEAPATEAPTEAPAEEPQADPAATPWGKYEDTVTVHLGSGLDPNATFPEGQSKENNTYLDFIRDEFNIEVEYDWICSTADFDQKMNLCIASNTLPDLMNVNATQYRAMLKYDQLQPIGDAFSACASDLLKSFVASGGDALMDLVSQDGEMMAIPAPNLISSSVNNMWIRQDWLDKLGLSVPQTVEELKAVAKAFVEQDPDGNGEKDTIGIIGPSNSDADHLNIIGQNRWGLDPIFAAFGSYPNTWTQDEQGNVVYGSTTPETKLALAELATMYAEGMIDPEMLVRSDSAEPVLAGKAGIFFGPWWCGYTVQDTFYGENGMDWQSYAVPLDAEGNFTAKMAAPTTQYIVASKDCENPEAALKLVNLLLRDEQQWIADGLKESLNPSDAYPLFNVYDNADEIEVSYDVLTKLLKGEITKADVDFSTHKLLENDMDKLQLLKKEPLDNFRLEYWDLENEEAKSNMGRLVSIMVGAKPVVETDYKTIYSVYYGRTDTMTSKWASLEKLEEESFAKIIMGQDSIDAFDTFVENWYAQGGTEILAEISDIIK